MEVSNKCLSPIHMTLPNGHSVGVFRCGKCPNCLRQRSNELLVRTYREFVGQSLVFMTFTYDNEHCPVLHQHLEYSSVTGEIYSMQNNISESPFFFENAPYINMKSKSGKRVKRYLPLVVDSEDNKENIGLVGVMDIYYQTIRFRDMQNLFKRFRIKYQDVLKKYICVPEYGSCGYRPHYHLMAMNLSQEHIDYLVKDWESRYGHVDVRFPCSSSSRDVAKVSCYLSKYCNKGVFDCPYIKQGYCLAPRRSTPIGYGCGSDSDFEQLRKVLFAEDVIDWNKTTVQDLTSEQIELLKSRRVYNINGFHYPMPKYFIKKLLYERIPIYSEVAQKVVYRYRASELQKAVSSYILDELVADALRELEAKQRLVKDSCYGLRDSRCEQDDLQLQRIAAESRFVSELESSSYY